MKKKTTIREYTNKKEKKIIMCKMKAIVDIIVSVCSVLLAAAAQHICCLFLIMSRHVMRVLQNDS